MFENNVEELLMFM